MSMLLYECPQSYDAATMLLDSTQPAVRPGHIEKRIWDTIARRVRLGRVHPADSAHMVFESAAEADIADSLSLGHTREAVATLYPRELVDAVYPRWHRCGRTVYPEGSAKALRPDQLPPEWAAAYAAAPSDPIRFPVAMPPVS